MATGAPIVLLAATATVLRTNRDHQNDQDVLVSNDTANPLLLGGVDLSATQYGAAVAAGGQLRMSMNPLDTLYAYSANGGTIHVLSSP
jgi:hypothetical protein